MNEDIFSGYTQNFTGDCDGNGNIYLNPGDEKTCMITNDDIDIPPPPYTPPAIISPPPYVPKTATLHIMKLVINGSGATAIPSDFTLHVKKSSVDVVGSPAPGASSPGTMYSLSSGTYNISENMIS